SAADSPPLESVSRLLTYFKKAGSGKIEASSGTSPSTAERDDAPAGCTLSSDAAPTGTASSAAARASAAIRRRSLVVEKPFIYYLISRIIWDGLHLSCYALLLWNAVVCPTIAAKRALPGKSRGGPF